MNAAEKFELALIPLLGIACWAMSSSLASRIGVGNLLLISSALLLAQSLVRDLWLLADMKRTATTTEGGESPVRAAQCMCVESTIGATGIVVGALLVGIGISASVTMDAWRWSALCVVVLGFGFASKDYVLEWNPWRLRKDADHMNIIFKWKA